MVAARINRRRPKVEDGERGQEGGKGRKGMAVMVDSEVCARSGSSREIQLVADKSVSTPSAGKRVHNNAHTSTVSRTTDAGA
jgi:hypothetical protein